MDPLVILLALMLVLFLFYAHNMRAQVQIESAPRPVMTSSVEYRLDTIVDRVGSGSGLHGRVLVDEEYLVVEAPAFGSVRRAVLRRSEVQRICHHWQKAAVEHTSEAAPQFVRFSGYGRNWKELMAALEELGWPVERVSWV